MSFEEILRAVDTLDDTALTIEHLEALQVTMPTKEEAKLFATYVGNPSDLTLPDRFLFQVLQVTHLPTKIHFFRCKLNFAAAISELHQVTPFPLNL